MSAVCLQLASRQLNLQLLLNQTSVYVNALKVRLDWWVEMKIHDPSLGLCISAVIIQIKKEKVCCPCVDLR